MLAGCSLIALGMLSRQGVTVTWWTANITRVCRSAMLCHTTTEPPCPDGHVEVLNLPDGQQWSVCPSLRQYPSTKRKQYAGLRVSYLRPDVCEQHHGVFHEAHCRPLSTGAIVSHRVYSDSQCGRELADVANPPCSDVQGAKHMDDAHCPPLNRDTIQRVYNYTNHSSPDGTVVESTGSFFFKYLCGTRFQGPTQTQAKATQYETTSTVILVISRGFNPA